MRIVYELLFGLCIPFLGTVFGAACVFFAGRGKMNGRGIRGKSDVIGASAGLMTAAAFFSLLNPALAAPCGLWKAFAGFALAILLLSLVDRYLSSGVSSKKDKRKDATSISPSTFLTTVAVALHNIPEGMAVGTALASLLSASEGMRAQVFAISAAIAIQNFPDGAIVSLPLYVSGIKRRRAFGIGVLSGAVEPVFALVTFFLAGRFTALLPIFLAFAAGSMIYVVVRELVPEMKEEESSGMGGFAVGFLLLMTLDYLLGA